MSPRIAVFTKNRSNPAYEAARYGADRTARRLGATTTHCVPERPDNVTEQIALIESAIAARPDAVVFTPVHETDVNDAALGFEAARIPVFSFVTRATAGQPLCFVGSDDRALARDIARHLFSKIGGRGDILVLEGTPASATSHARLKGFQEALAEYPDIVVRLSLCGEYQRDVARDVYRAAADKLRGIDAILCANDVMALGVLDARGPAKGAQPPVVGINAIPEAIKAIAAGTMLATVNFDAMTMSSIATEAAVRHLRGESVPREIMLPVQVIDRTNYAPLDLPFPERIGPTWEEVMASASIR
ncbi:MAG: sugar ABC transporter substrate-binding protein [Pseudolabrys sp.]|nr:sugar ABC transporter substrate-binding protein [Pseudolabrys sp.]